MRHPKFLIVVSTRVNVPSADWEVQQILVRNSFSTAESAKLRQSYSPQLVKIQTFEYCRECESYVIGRSNRCDWHY